MTVTDAELDAAMGALTPPFHISRSVMLAALTAARQVGADNAQVSTEIEQLRKERDEARAEANRLRLVYGDFRAVIDDIAFGSWAGGHDAGEIFRQLERRLTPIPPVREP